MSSIKMACPKSSTAASVVDDTSPSDLVNSRRVDDCSQLCHRCLVSPNGRWIMILHLDEICIYQCPSGERHGSLKLKGQGTYHAEALDAHLTDTFLSGWSTWSSFILNPENPNQELYTVSAEGTIVLWNFLNGGAPLLSWRVLRRNAVPLALYFQSVKLESYDGTDVGYHPFVLMKCNVEGSKREDSAARHSTEEDQQPKKRKLYNSQAPAEQARSRGDVNVSQSGRPARLDGRLFMASFVTTTEKKTTNNRSDSHRRQSSLVRYVKLDRSILKDLSLDPDKISFHSSGNFVAAITDNELRIFFMDKEVFRMHLIRERLFTCIACHPKQQCVATGDSGGRILLWYGLEDHESVTKTILHWHSSTVGDLSFSLEGSYLWSGGKENTLVLWSMADINSKDFLPRMTGAIERLSSGNESGIVAVSHENMGVTLVGPQRNTVCRVGGFVLPKSHRLGAPLSPLLAWDPISNALVLRGQSGQLLFCTADRLKVLKTMEVVQQNVVSSGVQQADWQISNAEVDAVAIHEDGKWMASADSLFTSHVGASITLKFWFYDATVQRYALRSTVVDPHDGEVVNVISFSPFTFAGAEDLGGAQRPLAASLAKSAFKVWMAINERSQNGIRQVWQCCGAGEVGGLTPGSAVFTPSMLTVSFADLMTFWRIERETGTVSMRDEMLCHVDVENDNPSIRDLIYVPKKGVDLLVSAAQKSVCIWDLDKWRVVHMVEFATPTLALDKLTALLLICGEETVLCIDLGKEEPSTVFRRKLALNKSRQAASEVPDRSRIVAGVAVPPSRNDLAPSAVETVATSNDILLEKLHVILLTSDNQVWRIGGDDENSVPANLAVDHGPGLEAIEESSGGYGALVSALAVQKKEKSDTADTVSNEKLRDTKVERMLDTPAHLIPDICKFMSSYLKTLQRTYQPNIQPNNRKLDTKRIDERKKNHDDVLMDSDDDDASLRLPKHSKPQDLEKSAGVRQEGDADAFGLRQHRVTLGEQDFDFLKKAMALPPVFRTASKKTQNPSEYWKYGQKSYDRMRELQQHSEQIPSTNTVR